ncbi:hypothetical protein GOC91_28125 [Sinorhizobium medicae]|uniref:Uncharacterized protein n=2 Tax=Sinorhizobium medicae TaxID=110321 RepID=A0A508WWR2_9HYPH|nr:hypothetical protein [Sinorhizobium medicae]ABR60222.1 hypothetical protein Smed_1376 [Sinorhizobium medicae WSM419]MBO1940236.1 hypothetical protein [Sinorhizobium medicae]MBO1962389.1 hypothetical protein [Sinorhizobium medicae]MDX0408761.1 hypothetical protein [Sinorhizobium medicae]MDX0413946.1 hypothetical protein [Sinorhizobium medicae]
MRDKHDFEWAEQRAATGLPVSVMLLSLLTIVVYLIVGSAFMESPNRVATAYAPQPAEAIPVAKE